MCKFDGFTCSIVYLVMLIALGVCVVFQSDLTETLWHPHYRQCVSIVCMSSSIAFLSGMILLRWYSPRLIIYFRELSKSEEQVRKSEDVLKYGLAILFLFVPCMGIVYIVPISTCVDEYKAYSENVNTLNKTLDVFFYTRTYTILEFFVAILGVVFAACVLCFCWNCMHEHFYRIWWIQVGEAISYLITDLPNSFYLAAGCPLIVMGHRMIFLFKMY